MKPTRLVLTFFLAATCFGKAFVSTAPAQNCNPILTQKLRASDGHVNGYFGTLVSVDGVWAIAIATGSDAAYFFKNNGSDWVEEQKLDIPDIDLGAIENDIAVVTDYGTEVIVFRRSQQVWIEEQRLTPSDGRAGERAFGSAVALSGNTIVVGAKLDDRDPTRSGAAYIYRYDGFQWVEEQKIVASNRQEGARFGSSAAVEGDVIVVGDTTEDDVCFESGAAYVFRFDPETEQWVEEQKLKASDCARGDIFGQSVSVSGGCVVVGAIWHEHAGFNGGAAYVYEFDGSQWIERRELLIPGSTHNALFGISVSVGGDWIVAGAAGNNGPGLDSGAAYLFHRDNGQWLEFGKLAPSDSLINRGFGNSVSMSGSSVMVGSAGDCDQGPSSGAAYVFDLNCGNAPALATLGTCPGPMQFEVTGATANERVAYLYARGTGSVGIPPGNPCAGTTLGLNATVALAGIETADENGIARFDVDVPNAACGRIFIQAINLSTCATTNVVGL